MKIPRTILNVWLIVIMSVLVAVFVVQPFKVARAASCSTKGGNSSGNWDDANTWTCNLVPFNTDNVTILAGDTVTVDGAQARAKDLSNSGTLNLNGKSFFLEGNYDSAIGAKVIGTGTFYALSGTQLCGNAQADFSEVTVFVQLSGSTNCAKGLKSAGLYISQGTLTFDGDSSIGFLSKGANLILNASLSVSGTWINSGGTFTPNTQTVTFNGSGTQTLTGNTAFYGLAVSSGSTLDINGTGSTASIVTATGTLRDIRYIGAPGAFTFGLVGGPINGANLSLNVTDDQFTSITIERHDTNHPNQTGSSATYGVGWGNYWTITPVGTGMVDVTLPTAATVGPNTKACRYTGTGTVWDCARDGSTTNSVTRNGVTTFSDWAVGSTGPTAITLNTLDAQAAPDTSAMGWLLVLLVGIVVSGLGLTRKAARR